MRRVAGLLGLELLQSRTDRGELLLCLRLSGLKLSNCRRLGLDVRLSRLQRSLQVLHLTLKAGDGFCLGAEGSVGTIELYRMLE